jgi:hypothetical protein
MLRKFEPHFKAVLDISNNTDFIHIARILIFFSNMKEPDCSSLASIVERVKSQINGDSEVLIIQT